MDQEHRHLPLLVSSQGNAFLLSSRLDSAVKCCSSEVLKLVSHEPDSFGKESGNFSRVSVCRKNAI